MKRNVLGVLVDDVDEDAAVDMVVAAAHQGRPLAVSALAVHGVMEAVRNPRLRRRVNELDLVTADGQPVRWALNLLHHAGLRDRVYGPTLMTRLVREGLPTFLYGSRPEVLEQLRQRLPAVVGAMPSRFAPAGVDEQRAIAAAIRESGARVVFVGLGCPRQEVFVHEMRKLIGVPLVAVGAAFDYHAGLRREPPAALQRSGLQWLWRLVAEPRRLWRRYVVLNPVYVVLLAAQWLRLWRPTTEVREPLPVGQPIDA